MEKGNQKRRGRRGRKRLASAVLAVALAGALAIGLVPDSTGRVYAAEPVADGDTKTGYSLSLGSSRSTRYNGRVWTDKSVSTGDVTFSGDAGSVTVPIETGEDASDFLVTYSALATSAQVSGESSVPVDVVFVVDLSGSMSNDDSGMDDGSSRIAHVVDALNESIETLMASNSESRIAVVGYSSTAVTLLPLDHYTKQSDWWGNEYEYFSLNWTWPSEYYATLTVRAVNSSGRNVTQENISVSGGTNVQMGIYQGMNILASEETTTTTVGSQEVKRVPSVVIMSDGAATYSSDSISWWNPSNNDNDGPGSDSYYGNGMKAMMTAAYMKQAIDRNYLPASAEYAAKVYTIGIGTSDLDNNDDRNLANITLNPKDHWNDNNDMANAIRAAWSGTSTGAIWEEKWGGGYAQDYADPGYTTGNGTGTPRIAVDGESHRQGRDWITTDEVYELTHPASYDIVDTGLQYNDAYYDAITSTDIENIFKDIVSSIDISRPKVPTKVSGNDPVHDGYITYTDYVGDYMEVDSVRKLIWAGTGFDNPTRSPESGTDSNGDVTYTFTGEINNPAYGEPQNVNQIQITVHTGTAADGTRTQTMTVRIPATAIPLRVNTIELNEDGGVVSNTSNNAYPLRLVYGVSLQDEIDQSTLEGVSEDYITAHTENGKVNFYSNRYSGNQQNGQTVGDAKVEFTPAGDNPFYFVQEDTPIYTDENGRNQVRNFDATDTYYVPVTYYEGNRESTVFVPRAAATMADYVDGNNTDGYHLTAGAPRLGNLEQFIQSKGTNTTGTAQTSFYPTFEGTDVNDGKFVVYLGNNGKLQLDAPASLIISKTVTADAGLTAPDAEFHFEITSKDKAGKEVSAVITTGSGEDAQEDTTVTFDADGKATVALKSNQSIELKGMSGADYSIQEVNIPDGFSLTNVTGAEEVSEGADKIASGTVEAGTADETIVFTNNYSVAPVTSTDLNIPLNGSKTITGRDFQQDDSFTFTIAAAQATPNAPLPTEDTDGDGSAVTATVKPTSGQTVNFGFGAITFEKPGEYRYIIQESRGELAGVSYDSAIYRVNIVIKDNGDGTLGLAEANEITGTAGNLTYPSNPFIQKYVNGGFEQQPAAAVAFENRYSAEETEAVIQGTKVLNATNSDRILADDEFTFKIEALGSNTDGGDLFTVDAIQPMPAQIEVTNIANGNVSFASMTFTQEMAGKTYGYKIIEVTPTDEDLVTDGIQADGVTYDSKEKIVKITVSDNGHGQVVAEVSPDDGQAGDPNHFTFTNSYKPSETTIGGQGQAGIQVQKTFLNHAWTVDYSFTFTIKNTQAPEGVTAPMPAKNTLTVANPTSGSVNTETFGEMTFEQEGTYVYEITETTGSHDGVAYDSHTAKVTVTVTENEETGTLSAQVSYDNSTAQNDADKRAEAAAAFTNTYSAEFDNNTAVNLDGTKNLTVGGGSERTLDAGQFQFEVRPLDGAPYGDAVIDAGSSSYMVGNLLGTETEDGVFTGAVPGLLQNITYDLEDLDGAVSKDFVYLISEQQGEIQGITYDNAVYQVTVTVTDDGNGKISANDPVIVRGTMQDGTFTADENQEGVNGVVFNNSYTPQSAVMTPQAITKALTGRTLHAGEFEFEISLAEGDNSGVILPNSVRVENEADGTVQFGDITFTKAGTYVIEVREVIPDQAVNAAVEDGTVSYGQASLEQRAENGWTYGGIVYDNHVIRSTFTVTDRNGTLTAIRTGTTGSLTFENEFPTTGTLDGETNLKVTKVLEGRDWADGDSFTFALTGNDDTTKLAIADGKVDLPDNAENLVINSNTASHSTAFGDIVFHEAGTYEFAITEQMPEGASDNGDGTATLGNMTYDIAPQIVTVEVAQGDGVLNVTAKSAGELTFTNKVTPVGVAVDLDGTKVLEGGELSRAQFFFSVTSLDGAPMGDSFETANPNGVGGADAGHITLLNNIVYTVDDLGGAQSKDFQYIITEEIPSEGNRLPGLTYDDSAYQVTVTVTRNDEDGTLTASDPVIVKGSWDGTNFTADADQTDVTEVVFTNSYETGEAVFTPIEVTKELVGRAEPLKEGEFSFKMSIVNAKPDDGTGNGVELPAETIVSNDADGKVQFDDITFTKAGEYTLKITEVKPENADPSITYSDNVLQSTFTVEDLNGKLTVARTKESTGETTFVNVYHAEGSLEGAANLTVTKNIDGTRGWEEGDSFTFTLTGADAATQQAIDAGDIVLPENAGGLTITNETADHKAAFGDIVFKKAGEYQFAVTEQQGDIEGMIYDTEAHIIPVSVTDAGNGVLTAAVTEEQAKNPVITNRFDPEDAVLNGEANLKVTKTLKGRPWEADDKFIFILEADMSHPATAEAVNAGQLQLPGNAGGLEITGAMENHEGAFGDIRFAKAGTYAFIVTEQPSGITGITDDPDNARTIYVEVTEQDGVLSASLLGDGSDSLEFVNTYGEESSTDLAVAGKKELKIESGNNPPSLEGAFHFTITGSEGAPMPENTDAVSDADGKVDFGTITYTMENVFGAEEADIPENGEDAEAPDKETDAGEAVDGKTEENTDSPADAPETEKPADKVTDADSSLEGKDAADVTTEEPEEKTENAAEAEEPVDSENTADGEPAESDGAEAEEPKTEAESEEPEEPVDSAEAGSDEAGAEQGAAQTDSEVIQNSIVGLKTSLKEGEDAAAADGRRSKTFTYTITEQASGIPGITDDPETERTFTVTVTDMENGALKVECSETPGAQFTFTNTYSVQPEDSSPSVDGGFTLTKKLTGRELAANDFTFQLKGVSTNAEGMSLTAENDAEGKVTFGNLTFKETGEYTFAITEVNNGLGGITYDTARYTATAAVTDNGDGTLSAVWTFKNAEGAEVTEAVFANSYKAAPAYVTLRAEKLLEGRELKAGEFAFELKNADGTVLYRIVNAADGTVQFPQMTFESAGTYRYTISEQKGSLEGVSYDQSVYNVVITVTDNGSGWLKAAVDTEGKNVVFRNAYEAPEADNDGGSSSGGSGSSSPSQVQVSSAQTGDDTNILLPLIGICVSGAVLGICAVVIYNRKKKTE